MADPITIIGSVGGICNIVDVISKTISTISEVIARWKDADLVLLSLASQLTALKAALTGIQEWTGMELRDAHHQLVMDLDVSISCCKLLVTKIEIFVAELNISEGESLDIAGKMKVVFGVGVLKNVLKMIAQQTGALNLLLTACNCKSLAEQKQLLETPKTRKKLARAKSDTVSLLVHRDTASVVSKWTDNLSKISIVFGFDSEVFSSKVYERVFRGSLKQALRSRQGLPWKHVQEHGLPKGARRKAFVLLLGEDEGGKGLIMELLNNRYPGTIGGASIEDSSESFHDIACRNYLIERCLDRLYPFLRRLQELQLREIDYTDFLADTEGYVIPVDVGFQWPESKRWLAELCTALQKPTDTPYPVFNHPLFINYETIEKLAERLLLYCKYLYRSSWSDAESEIASGTHVLSELSRLASPNYVTTILDRHRFQHGGINLESYHPLEHHVISVLQLSGQTYAGTGVQWAILPGAVSAVILVVDLSLYHQSLPGSKTAIMDQTLQHFQKLVKTPVCSASSIVLVFRNITTVGITGGSYADAIIQSFKAVAGNPVKVHPLVMGDNDTNETVLDSILEIIKQSILPPSPPLLSNSLPGANNSHSGKRLKEELKDLVSAPRATPISRRNGPAAIFV